MKRIYNIYIKYQEIINYLIVGILTTVVSLLTYYVLVSTLLNPKIAIELQIANIISWVFAVIFAFITNRYFVFKSKNNKIFKEFISFVSSRILTLLVDMLIMLIMVTILGMNDKISKLIVQVTVTILNYIFSKLFVFKKS